MKYSEYFNESFGEVFDDTIMDINVSISRSRIIVNMPTVGNLINVYNELIRSYFKMEFTYSERVLENRITMLKLLPLKEIEHGPKVSNDRIHQANLVNRIYENLANSYGYAVNKQEEYQEFINKIYQVLKTEAEQFAFNNRLEGTDTNKRLNLDKSAVFSDDSKNLID